MSVSISQAKGHAHIRYIHDKAVGIFHSLYQGNDAYWIDALNQAMREHRTYLIASKQVDNQIEKRTSKADIMRGTWWKDNGIWRKLG